MFRTRWAKKGNLYADKKHFRAISRKVWPPFISLVIWDAKGWLIHSFTSAPTLTRKVRWALKIWSNKFYNWIMTLQTGNTSLHFACQSNELEIVENLIESGAEVNILNNKLQSPMHIAAEQGFTDICKLLLAAGANVQQKEQVSFKNPASMVQRPQKSLFQLQGGKTALYIAARGSFTAIVDMIIKTSRLDYPVQVSSPNPHYEIQSIAISGSQLKWRRKQYSGPAPVMGHWGGQARPSTRVQRKITKSIIPSSSQAVGPWGLEKARHALGFHRRANPRNRASIHR